MNGSCWRVAAANLLEYFKENPLSRDTVGDVCQMLQYTHNKIISGTGVSLLLDEYDSSLSCGYVAYDSDAV